MESILFETKTIRNELDTICIVPESGKELALDIGGGYYMNNFELYHYGILGQKWGVRRYQNLDRTLTPAGKERYGRYKKTEPVPSSEKSKKEYEHFQSIRAKALGGDASEENWKDYDEIQDRINERFNDGTLNKSGGNIFKSNDAYKGYNALDKALQKARSTSSGYTYNEQTGKWDKDEKAHKEYVKAWNEYWNLRYDVAGKVLKSIGYEDTKEAREFLDEWFRIYA